MLPKTFLDYIWIPLFEANLVSVYIVTFLIYSYLSGKPPGHQTVFDFVLCDVIIVIQSTMTIFTNIIALTKLNELAPSIRELQTENFHLVIGYINYFGYMLLLTSIQMAFCIRIVSISFVGFLDESIGDFATLLTTRSVPILTSTICLLIDIRNGGVGLTDLYTNLSRKTMPPGFKSSADCVITFTLLGMVILFIVMQSLVEWKKLKLRKAQPSRINCEDSNTKSQSDDIGDTRIFAAVISILLLVAYFFHAYFPQYELQGHLSYATTLSVCFTTFFVCPLQFIRRNPSMRAHAKQNLKTSARSFVNFLYFWQNWDFKSIPTRAKIYPISCTTNSKLDDLSYP